MEMRMLTEYQKTKAMELARAKRAAKQLSDFRLTTGMSLSGKSYIVKYAMVERLSGKNTITQAGMLQGSSGTWREMEDLKEEFATEMHRCEIYLSRVEKSAKKAAKLQESEENYDG